MICQRDLSGAIECWPWRGYTKREGVWSRPADWRADNRGSWRSLAKDRGRGRSIWPAKHGAFSNSAARLSKRKRSIAAEYLGIDPKVYEEKLELSELDYLAARRANLMSREELLICAGRGRKGCGAVVRILP
jgi:hypothetical protein